MAIPSSLITNLSLGGIGLTAISGLVYGGYELLKHDPREVKSFLKVKKRTLLSTNGNDDEATWKTNWAKYIANNTPKPQASAKPSETGGQTTQTPQVPEEPKKDIWNLDGWEKHKSKPTEVPPIFKTTCTNKSNEKVNGIWSDTFKQVVDYCTKEAVDED